MLNQPTLNALRTLKLTGMAEAFAQQLEQPAAQQLAFDERFAWLVQCETTYRENRRLQRLLQLARLRQSACVEEIDYRQARGLERSVVAQLSTCDWIRQHHNLHLTGPTGTGKSWLACAFGQQACRQGFTVRYEPAAAVQHGHRYTLSQLFRRNFDSGYSLREISGDSKSSYASSVASLPSLT